MKVYIVRHGQVPHNAKKVYSNENENLNEVGLQQAKELKSKINFINYDIIIKSRGVQKYPIRRIDPISDRCDPVKIRARRIDIRIRSDPVIFTGSADRIRIEV